MPLLDHFHAPLDERYPWESFHSGWATRIADQLSERVPAEFVVAEHTHSGNHFETTTRDTARTPQFPEAAATFSRARGYADRLGVSAGLAMSYGTLVFP